MSNPAATIKRWQMVIIIYTLCIALLALAMIPNADNQTGQFMAIALGIDAVILVIGVVLLMNFKFKLAVIFVLLGGLITLPLGGLLFWAAIRIRSASERLESEEPQNELGLQETPR
jgi:hypothetical protein